MPLLMKIEEWLASNEYSSEVSMKDILRLGGFGLVGWLDPFPLSFSQRRLTWSMKKLCTCGRESRLKVK